MLYYSLHKRLTNRHPHVTHASLPKSTCKKVSEHMLESTAKHAEQPAEVNCIFDTQTLTSNIRLWWMHEITPLTKHFSVACILGHEIKHTFRLHNL